MSISEILFKKINTRVITVIDKNIELSKCDLRDAHDQTLQQKIREERPYQSTSK